MLVKIGNKIKELRKRDGRTQETVANAIGVSPQAISRWEAGGGYPDMEIVPAIANYFGVTIDALFGYECERQQKIDALVAEIQTMNIANNGEDVCIDACLSKARQGLIEFPGDESLTLCLAELLYNAGYARYGAHYLTDADGYQVHDTARHRTYLEWQEAIKLYEKLLVSLSGGELRQQATKGLIQLYLNCGEYRKAKELAENAPAMYGCRELLRLSTCDGKELVEAYGVVAAQTLSLAAVLAVSRVMLQIELLPATEAIEQVEKAIELLCFNGDEPAHFRQIAELEMYLSQLLWKKGDQGAAFGALSQAATYAKRHDAHFGTVGDDRIAPQLPELWPVWYLPDGGEVEKAIKADDKWVKWVDICRG